MRLICALTLALATVASSPSRAADAPEPRDYAQLSHVLAVESLRAGNHDASGVNDYYFTATMMGLLNTSEERNLEFDKRKKLTVDLGAFGDAHMQALSVWHPDEKTKDVKELRIEGDAVRDLVARTMTTLAAAEGDVAVTVIVTLWEREKKLMFFGEDRKITQTEYHPIPPSQFDQTSPYRTNVSLSFGDDKGTLVKLAVRYDHPIEAPKGGASAKAEPRP